jgi:phage baseplate assembly protein W
MPVEITYGLNVPSTQSSSIETTIGKEIVNFPSFLGFGLITPFRREASDFANSGGGDHIQSMVSQVLGTRAGSEFTQGELPWRSDFGSLTEHLRHKNNKPILQDLARVYIAEALSRWIPQIQNIHR